MRSWLVLAAAIATTPLAAAQTYPTIVGEWYTEKTGPQDCGGPHAIHIGPKTYVEDALSCSFEEVARDGWRVTWDGSYNDGNGTSPMLLVATEDNGRLTLTFNENPGWSALRRCTR